MFNQLLAIDVVDRMDDGLKRLSAFSKASPIVVKTASETSSYDLSSVDAVVVSIYQELSESFFQALPKLSYVGVLGTSCKLLPMSYLSSRGVKVRNVSEYCDEETAEWVMLRIAQFFRERTPSLSIAHKKLGVVGVGGVGQKLIHLARAFHMEIFYNSNRQNSVVDEYATFLSKEEMFATCDVISCHTPAFFPWVTRELLESAKANLCLIDTCMGKISNDDDLERWVRERKDVRVILDAVAGIYYPQLKADSLKAFDTNDAQKKLVDRFVSNLRE